MTIMCDSCRLARSVQLKSGNGAHLNLVASSWVCVEARNCSSVGSSLLGDAVVTGPGPDAGRVVLGAGRGTAEAAGGAAGRAPDPTTTSDM